MKFALKVDSDERRKGCPERPTTHHNNSTTARQQGHSPLTQSLDRRMCVKISKTRLKSKILGLWNGDMRCCSRPDQTNMSRTCSERASKDRVDLISMVAFLLSTNKNDFKRAFRGFTCQNSLLAQMRGSDGWASTDTMVTQAASVVKGLDEHSHVQQDLFF